MRYLTVAGRSAVESTFSGCADAPPLDVRLSKNTVEGFSTYSIPLLVSQKRVPKEFDPAPAVDPRFVAAAMKADPSAFADLKEIPADKRM